MFLITPNLLQNDNKKPNVNAYTVRKFEKQFIPNFIHNIMTIISTITSVVIVYNHLIYASLVYHLVNITALNFASFTSHNFVLMFVNFNE